MRRLWTDGSAIPNPGKGGFAVIEGGKPVLLGAENPSTNIRMEGLAICAAIEYAQGEKVEIWTDSEFWVNVINKWMRGWKERGWKKSNGTIRNLDIVKKLDSLCENNLVEVKWVRGHSGIEMNEMADVWANKAREKMADGLEGEFVVKNIEEFEVME